MKNHIRRASCVAQCTFHSVVTLAHDAAQVSIDTNAIDVRSHAGTYCEKGEWHGRLTFRFYNEFVATYEHVVRPDTLLIIERISDEHFRFGTAHPPSAICSAKEFWPAFEEWLRRVDRLFPSLCFHDLLDLKQNVGLRVAERLIKGNLIIYSPGGFLTMVARRLQINTWLKERRTTSLTSEAAASIPSPMNFLEVLEIEDEMKAMLISSEFDPENLRLLRDEMLELDPVGTIRILGDFLARHGSRCLSDFYQTWIRSNGDPSRTASECGISQRSVRTYLYRIQLLVRGQSGGNAVAA